MQVGECEGKCAFEFVEESAVSQSYKLWGRREAAHLSSGIEIETKQKKNPRMVNTSIKIHSVARINISGSGYK